MFLFVAAFLLNVVLTRLVFLQRPQIAPLQAVGYPNWRIGLHYVELVSLVVVAGAIVGIAVGAYLGRAMSNLYAQYFHFPESVFRVEPRLAAIAVLVSVVAALTGALGAVRSILKLVPAEAMRPPTPLVYRLGWIEKLGLDRVFGGSGRMVIRELRRQPVRTLLSSVGIALGVGIVVIGRFQADAFESLIDVQFFRAWREDVSVAFVRAAPERVVRELAQREQRPDDAPRPARDRALLGALALRLRARDRRRRRMLFVRGRGHRARLRLVGLHHSRSFNTSTRSSLSRRRRANSALITPDTTATAAAKA